MQVDCIIVLKVKRILKHISYYFPVLLAQVYIWNLCQNLSTTKFIKSFKKLISRRGNPNIIYSDNTETLRAGAKWLNSINRDGKFHNFLSKEKITWKSNLSRASLWERQYERLIGLTKQSLYKSIGKSLLTWSELEGELSDVKLNLNNRLLTYIEEDLEYSMLTLNSVILERDMKLPDDSPEEEEVSENWKK